MSKSYPKYVDQDNKEMVQIYNSLEDGSESILLLGKAGSGKTTFLQNYIKDKFSKSIVTIAPTGIAALNAGGQTIHKFFGFSFEPKVPNDSASLGRVKGSNVGVIEGMDILVIDEVSMVRADLLDAIDYTMRSIRINDSPFGGVKVLMVGDPYQLSPVYKFEEKKVLSKHYKDLNFFDAKVFQGDIKCIELKKVYRQNDQEFLDILNNIRLNRDVFKSVTKLNKTCIHRELEGAAIELAPTNAVAKEINSRHLYELTTNEYDFSGSFQGEFDKNSLPTDEVLKLKVGSQVMFVKNDQEERYVNGTIGIVKEISNGIDPYIKVQVSDDKELIKVGRHMWENFQYKSVKGRVEKKITGSFTQIPLKLAWAVTIHKSQGLTFDKMRLNMGKGMFNAGQLYVALSRCKTLEGLSIIGRIRPSDVKSVDVINEFIVKTKRGEINLAKMSEEERVVQEFIDETQPSEWALENGVMIEHLVDFYKYINSRL